MPHDQKDAKVALGLLMAFIESHPELDGNIWASAVLGLLANTFCNNGISYEEFREEISQALDFYRNYWD